MSTASVSKEPSFRYALLVVEIISVSSRFRGYAGGAFVPFGSSGYGSGGMVALMALSESYIDCEQNCNDDQNCEYCDFYGV